MPKNNSKSARTISAQPRLHQHAKEIQAYGTVTHFPPLELDEPTRLEMTAQLNQLLADTITLRDLYKKSHWQVVGPTFFQLHLLFDTHFGEQVELVDSIAERIQLLGGVSIAMAADVAQVLRSSVRHADAKKFQYSFRACSTRIRSSFARARGPGALLRSVTTAPTILSLAKILRTNELQVWFLSLVDVPLVEANPATVGAA